MIPLKTQVEIRFSPLLNFRNIYKPIIAPFIKFSKFQIFDGDTYNEYVIMQFPEEGYMIDVRWDRIIFRSDGKKDNLFTAQGPLFYFFSILGKFKEHEEFGEIKQLFLAQWTLFQSEKSEDQIIKDFQDKYLKCSPIFDDYTFQDSSVIMEYTKKNETAKIHFGPFKPKSDIENYKLIPISSEQLSKDLKKRGILAQCTIIDKEKNPETSTFKKMDKLINILHSKILQHG